MLLQVRDVGDWICFPETVHELYAHLAELIGNINFGGFGFISLSLLYTELNGNKGLKNLSEENLEVILSIYHLFYLNTNYTSLKINLNYRDDFKYFFLFRPCTK